MICECCDEHRCDCDLCLEKRELLKQQLKEQLLKQLQESTSTTEETDL